MKHSRLAIIAIIAILSALQPAFGSIIYVKHNPGQTPDGKSWATAFDRVQDAVNAAVSNDEIWVAAGTYSENIILFSGIALYGGFAGGETVRTQRNFRANVCILDGGWNGPTVEVARSASSATRIDGFRIINGRAVVGGGIYCNQNSVPVIVNNVITANSANCEGGGIYCNTGSAPTIASNRIIGNGAVVGGGGVCTVTGAAKVTSNFIASNASRYGGAICCGDSNTTNTASHEYIVNNTIYANSANYGGAVYLYGLSSASISNNIMSSNSSGIAKKSGTGAPALKKNCMYANDAGNYSGLSAGSTDVFSDPQLGSASYGEMHIQPGSPCAERGLNTEVIAGFDDIDGQARVQGTVDIGADESDGSSWTVTPVIVRVAPGGSDSNDGSSWAAAKRTIQAAVERAAASGGEVWVKAGTYYECLTMRDFVYIYGGFGGSETVRSARNWKTQQSIIDAQKQDSVVTATNLGFRVSAIDGFTLRNGDSLNGSGIMCDHASPLVMNNTITGNDASACGAGIYLANSASLLKNNQISGNDALLWGGGVFEEHSSAEVATNQIRDNSAALAGGGIYTSADTTSRIINNLISANHEDPAFAWIWGAGIATATYSPPTILFNTIAGNSLNGMAAYCGAFGILNMRSNIIAYNGAGIRADKNATIASISNNCVYGPSGYTYSGLSAGAGDISVDPQFVNQPAGDYRLLVGSPCIDVADLSSMPADDILGILRPQDGNNDGTSSPDIGAYEYVWGSNPNVPTLTSVLPAEGPNTAVVTIKLTGANFASGASVKLARTGYGDISASSVKVIGPTQITCSLNLIRKRLGLWDVVVTNPDGQSASLQKAFAITVHKSLPFVGALGGSLKQSVMRAASLHWQVCVWGKVEVIDSSSFWLDDKSGLRVKVYAPGYTGLANGDYASARGTADVSDSVPLIISAADVIVRYN